MLYSESIINTVKQVEAILQYYTLVHALFVL